MPPSLTIRPMTDKDIPATAKLLAAAFNASAFHTEQDLASAAHKGDLRKTFVATTAEGKVVGVSICENNGETFSIEMLAVTADQRRAGIGAQLMQHTENFMRDNWLHGQTATIAIEDLTKRGNGGSRYYENMGYERTGKTGSTGAPVLYKTLSR